MVLEFNRKECSSSLFFLTLIGERIMKFKLVNMVGGGGGAFINGDGGSAFIIPDGDAVCDCGNCEVCRNLKV